MRLHMKWLHRRRWAEQRLDKELRFHLDRLVEELIAAGMPRDEAERRARLQFGGLEQVKEDCREERSFAPIETTLQDLRYGARLLRKSPGFTAVAALSLALGIGANTAIFSVIDALMLKTLPIRNPEQLVAVSYWSDFGSMWAYHFSRREFELLRDHLRSFSGLTAIRSVDRSNLMHQGPGGGLDAGQVQIDFVSGNYFSTLGVNPAIGTFFVAADDGVPGANAVAVISFGYWKRRFGFAPDVVGRTFTLQGATYTILGVAAPRFSGDQVGQPADLWMPIAMLPVTPLQPNISVRIVGRLKPDTTIQRAQAEIHAIDREILREIVGQNVSPQDLRRTVLQPAARGISWQRRLYERPLQILMIVVGLVLLIACANVANLLLARSAARQREIGIRLALGASRGRIVRQLLGEGALLAILAGGLGLLFARWGTIALAKLAGSGLISMHLDLDPDARMLLFTAAASLLTGILFGVAPAFRASSVAPSPSLKSAWRASGRYAPGKLLVVSQVALSLILLIGAGLFARTLRNLKSQDLGYEREHVLVIATAPDQSGRSGESLASLFRTTQQRISSLPGVLSASPSSGGLLTGGGNFSPIRLPGYTFAPGEARVLQWNLVGPRYFESLGMRLLAGRDFTERDTEESPRVAIINESMARHYFGRPDAVGRRFGIRRDTGNEIEIVGVVKDAKYNTLRDQDPRMIYLPYRQDVAHLRGAMWVAVRTIANQPSLTARIRDELRSIDSNLAILTIDSMEEQLDKALTVERLTAWLSSVFGLLAVLLACIGLYGVMSYVVARRTNEMGIRLALGATRAGVLISVLGESLRPVLTGIALGFPAALALTRLVSSQLFGIDPADPWTISIATALMIAVAAIAGFLPARRAARVDPIMALRYE